MTELPSDFGYDTDDYIAELGSKVSELEKQNEMLTQLLCYLIIAHDKSFDNFVSVDQQQMNYKISLEDKKYYIHGRLRKED